MTFSLPKLPYEKTALEPYISRDTLNFHYDKHHQTYVTKLNELVEGTEFAGMELEDVIRETENDPDLRGVFNNAAQVWNHTFYWHCMKQNGGGKPSGDLLALLEENFGTYENFFTAFKQAALTQFGSGWAWLVADKDTLKIVKTSNAETPLTQDITPLLTCDVWEHAYYLDYQNKRPDYVETFLNHLVNWDFVEKNLSR
jgi:Fe-Mn family superoxide dismutase